MRRRFVERIENLRSFDVIRYAQKACSNLAILDLMRRQGVLVDAVSAGEIQRALAAGYTAAGQSARDRLHGRYLRPRRSADGGRARYSRQCRFARHDRPDWARSAPGRNITLRINPGFGHGQSQKTNTGGEHSKHGIWHEQLEDCLRRADRHGLGVTGLHMHIGSGTDLEHLAQVCGAMQQAAAARRAQRDLDQRRRRDCRFLIGRTNRRSIWTGYFQQWDAHRKRLEEEFGHAVSRWRSNRAAIWWPRAAIWSCEIRAVKRTGDNIFYLLDAGFNNLARPVMYGAYHPMSIVPRDGDTQAQAAGRGRGWTAVRVGRYLHAAGRRLCQSRRSLPVASVGDWLVIECAGAYGFVMSSNYNSKPMAAEVLIRDGTAHLVRARQTYEDLMRGECIRSVSSSRTGVA